MKTLSDTYSVTLGTTPVSESCLQVGHDDPIAIRKEAKRYCEQLRRLCAPLLATLGDAIDIRVVSHPHDFGLYYDVEAIVDGENEDAARLAAYLETDAPATWTELAEALPLVEIPALPVER